MPHITAHSMISSLGSDAAIACAAARAGLLRAAPIDGPLFTFDVTGEAEPMIGHEVPLITRGFEGPARLRRLLVAGLRELRGGLAAGEPAQAVALYLSWPDPERLASGLDLVPDEQAREVARERSASLVGTAQDPATRRDLAAFVRAAAAEAGWAGDMSIRHLSFAGHAGGAECLALACNDLVKGEVAQALVGGVDSLLDADTAAWLHNTGRLKLSGMPVGLMPGEAAAFLLLAAAPGEGAQAEVVAAGLTAEPKTLWSGATSVGQGLAGAIEQVLPATGWKEATSAWVLSDLNGEVYRANEWGHVVARLRAEWPALADTTLWLPAASFGDTGAASALVAVCTALQAQRRRHAPAAHAVVVSSSEGPARSALLLRAPASDHQGRTHGT